MKKIIFVFFLLLNVVTIAGQTYKTLWKTVSELEEKDLPRSEIDVLRQIKQKALGELAYGQLLKAEVKEMMTWNAISPDSMQTYLQRLVETEKNTTDKVLDGVYCAAIYRTVSSCFRESQVNAHEYKQKAMENMSALAKARCADYEPFVVQGNMGKYFMNDLLSVVGYETDNFEALSKYYNKVKLKPAALLTALKCIEKRMDDALQSGRILKYYGHAIKTSLDSLEEKYSDLDVCGELAVTRLDFMELCQDVKPEDKINAIHHALNRWKMYERMNILRNMESALTTQCMNVEISKQQILPNKTFRVGLNGMRNIQQLTMNIYRTNLNGDTNLNPYATEELAEIKKNITSTALSTTKSFYGHKEYDFFDDSLMVSGLIPGVYLVEVSSQKLRPLYNLLHVSNVNVLSQAVPGGQTRIAVLNATTGAPLPKSHLKLYYDYKNNSSFKEATTDENGEVVVEKTSKTIRKVVATTIDDTYALPYTPYGTYSFNGKNGKQEYVKIFTDRSIYRPGQTIQVSVLDYELEGETTNVVAGREITITLKDANWKIVEEKKVTTDEYGTAATDFVIPKGLMNGRFVICANKSNHVIRVEEYKRPTFEITFPEITKKYQNGDTLMIHTRVKSYAGAPIQNAKIYYKVKRQQAFWWWKNSKEELMKEDSTITDKDGCFWLTMDMVLPENCGRNFYNFIGEVKATSLDGETHEAVISVPLGSKAALLSVNIPEQIQRDSLRTMTFSMKNAAGHEVNADVRYWFDNESECYCRTQQQIDIVPQLTCGRHNLTAICEDDTLRQSVVVFTDNDTVPCVETHDWFWQSSKTFPRDGKPVTIQVGSSDAELHILYSVCAKDKIIEQGHVDINSSLLNRKFYYKEEYGDGLLLTFAWIKDGKTYTHNATIRRPLPEKELKLRWETFRDRLTPGQKETWRLRVAKNDDAPVAACHVLAAMYDKSLDQLYPHSWTLSLGFTQRLPNTSWRYLRYGSINMSGYNDFESLTVPEDTWNSFDASLFEVYDRMPLMKYSSRPMIGMTATTAMAKADNLVFEVADMSKNVRIRGNAASESANETTPSLRTVEAATAFFYPNLLTDKDGIATISFTVPEVLTTWHLLSLAHTKEMDFGFIDDDAVASKTVMVQPNMPRFIRLGDEATISASIINTTEQKIIGNAVIQIENAETGNIILRSEKKFSIKNNETTAVDFDINTSKWQKIASENPILICKIFAEGDEFSDGEQHYLVLLPNEEMVTSSASITQHGKGTATIDLHNLVGKNPKNGKLTIEYTNNPAWMIVQAIPSISSQNGENVISYLRSYYCSSLAGHLLNSNPDFQKTINLWAQQDDKSMISKLRDNEELKSVVLNETPWVAASDKETEWMSRLTNYYNPNFLSQSVATDLEKIKELQLPDGTWAWFKGMEGNLYLTMTVVEKLLRLNSLTASNANAEMLQKAMEWMNKEINKNVERMKKEEKEGREQTFPGRLYLEYLYACSLSGMDFNKSTKDSHDYLISLLKKEIKDQTLYEKALTAMVLIWKGEKSVAAEFVKSLKEYSVFSDEMGRYYDSKRAAYSWRDYRIPTHVAAIEAIRRVSPADHQTIEEMQRWLLQEKRTQFWGTPLNCMDAIYAFMTDNAKAFQNGEQTVVKLEGKDVDFDNRTMGLGYCKTSVAYNGEKEVTFDKSSDGTSWGAVYSQSLQPLASVQARSNGMTITRSISKQKDLKVGDKVTVTMTIKADRDYDFVQIVDKRPACMEPVQQLSGMQKNCYVSTKDCSTMYFIQKMPKGTHEYKTDYFIDRAGRYLYAPASVECAYSPDFQSHSGSEEIIVKR